MKDVVIIVVAVWTVFSSFIVAAWVVAEADKIERPNVHAVASIVIVMLALMFCGYVTLYHYIVGAIV